MVGHLRADQGEPGDVAQPLPTAADRLAAEEPPPPEHRVVGAQLDKLADVVEQLLIGFGTHRPVDPGDLVVLAVGVVVALLRAPHLVAREQHRDTLGQQQRGQEVPLLPGPQGQDGRVIGRALDTAVPGPVVVAAVPVALPVGLVVLVVVGDQVLQGKPVVSGDEVDRGDRAPAVLLVQVAGPGEPGRELGQRGGLAAPEVTDGVPVLAVPFAPQRGEVADVVAAVAHVPRFGDELDLGYHRVLLD